MYVYSVQSRVFKRMNVCNIRNRNSKIRGRKKDRLERFKDCYSEIPPFNVLGVRLQYLSIFLYTKVKFIYLDNSQ